MVAIDIDMIVDEHFSQRQIVISGTQNFLGNIQRDEENNRLLASMGWKALILWECETRKNVYDCIKKVKILLALAKNTAVC
jgi:G:T-mismatch repair DNA endonuclease (very short patch repair protein)